MELIHKECHHISMGEASRNVVAPLVGARRKSCQEEVNEQSYRRLSCASTWRSPGRCASAASAAGTISQRRNHVDWPTLGQVVCPAFPPLCGSLCRVCWLPRYCREGSGSRTNCMFHRGTACLWL